MRKSERKAPDAEPIGIIISRGPALSHAPRFSAYVWAAVDDPDTTSEDPKAT